MPTLCVEIPHHLSVPEASKRIRQLISEAQSRFPEHKPDLQESPDGSKTSFALRVSGINVTGEIEVLNDRAIISAALPLRAALFKGKAESILREKLQATLNA